MDITRNGQTYSCNLVDDGTLDTVISVDGEEFRFSHDYASWFRDDEGNFFDEGFLELCDECIDEIEARE